MLDCSQEIRVFSKYSKQLIILAALLACLLPGGCVGPHSGGGINRPAYCVTVQELASRLGLAVISAGNPYYEMTNANNTVRLFMYDEGRAYVNGNPIGPVGTIRQGDTEYVPELLVPKIRASLIPDTPVKPWTPAIPSVTPKTGSGIVVIDPGHGGDKPGAKSVLGYKEKGINLQISRKLIAYLKQAGVTVHTTRTDDINPTLEERAVFANQTGADLFISVHCNSIVNKPTIKGFIVFTAEKCSPNTQKVARKIENKISDSGIYSRGIQHEDFRVLVQTECPAVLLECGFMSNRDEAALLMNPWYQDKLARAITDGILDYLQ